MITVTVYSRTGLPSHVIALAASMLMINTVNAIEVLTQNGVMAENQDGFLTCVFPAGLDDEGMLLMEAMLLGLTQIQDDYKGEYLQVVMKEE